MLGSPAGSAPEPGFDLVRLPTEDVRSEKALQQDDSGDARASGAKAGMASSLQDTDEVDNKATGRWRFLEARRFSDAAEAYVRAPSLA